MSARSCARLTISLGCRRHLGGRSASQSFHRYENLLVEYWESPHTSLARPLLLPFWTSVFWLRGDVWRCASNVS